MTATRRDWLQAVLALGLVLGSADAQDRLPTVTRDYTIGCAECGGALQFASFQEVALLPDGRLLVVDRDAPMLRLFGENGAPIWAKGTRGGGPGEYQYVIRVAPMPSGALLIADMSARRLTTLSATGDVTGTAPLQLFATTAGTDGRGGLVLGAEPPVGALRIFRVVDGAVTPVTLPAVSDPAAPDPGERAAGGSSVALSPSGVIAVVVSNERYRIRRIDATGTPLEEITRAIERVRRTPAEEAALRQRMGRDMGAVRAAAERQSGVASSAGTPALHSTSDLSLKPHLAVDGLRYDGAGRLWARTMRGDDAHTIFDVFAPSGAFLGSVTLDGVIHQFAFGGEWMATSGEDADGVPQVTRWRVR